MCVFFYVKSKSLIFFGETKVRQKVTYKRLIDSLDLLLQLGSYLRLQVPGNFTRETLHSRPRDHLMKAAQELQSILSQQPDGSYEA